ncbi:MAG: outer membrane protein transport protein [Kiritimatiellae bacterium]|nr:outer membrane protein transport protein [Kiritimatiellia bacterium]
MLLKDSFWYRTRRLALAVALLILLITMRLAIADGFRNPPPDAAGIGRAGVFIAHVDNLSGISYNPAVLSLIEGPAVGAGVTLARTQTEFDGAIGSAESDDPWQILPNLYAAWPVDGSKNALAVGLGITTPFGQSVEWEKDSIFRYIAPYYVRMRLVDLNPTLATRVGENLYAGISADVFLSDVQFKGLADNGPAPGDARLDLEGEGIGWGAHAGLLWLVSSGQRLALTVRSPVSVDYEGDARLRSLPAPLPGRADFETTIDFPTIVALGYGIEIGEAVRVEFDVEWLEFSRNESIELDTDAYDGVIPAEFRQDWDDTWTAGVSGDWKFTPGWILRAGYAFLESPVADETFAPTLPDADRHVLSLGLGYENGPHRCDLAYSWSLYEDREIRNNQVPPLNGDYEICSDLLGLSYFRAF